MVERDITLAGLFQVDPDYPYFEGVDEVRGLIGDRSLYDPVVSWILAEASMLAYVRDEARVREHLARLGEGEVLFFDGKGAQGYLARTAEQGLLVFRGTEPHDLHDILADLRFLLVKHEEKGLVHQGFDLALNSVWGEVGEALAEMPPKGLWVTGHSLGGALALLAGYRLRQIEAVYTYGTPRVGNNHFCETYPCPVFRVVNNNDIVTMVPPPLLYRHVGETHFIDHEGHVVGETSALQQAESRWLGHLMHAGDILQRWRNRDYSGIPNQNMTDHAPINYVRLLQHAVFGEEEDGEKA